MQTNQAAVTVILGSMVASSAGAAVMYDTGSLDFESSGQSMWDSGSAFRREESVFVGSQWSNRTATIGGIVGNQDTVIIPGTNSYTVTWYEPKVNFGLFSVGCGCRKSKTIPGIPAVTADTRTGAELKLHTSGKVGLEFGYSIDSGSVDTTANFRATANLPDQVEASQFFSLDTASSLDGGTIQTQSPKVEAYMSAIMQLSGSIDAKACLAPFGCSPTGTAPLPTIDMDQRILSVDVNSIKVLDGAGPGGQPIAETALFNQSLTLEGGATVAPPVVGFKLTTLNGAATIVNTLPPSPSLTVDMAEVTVQVPDIATNGSGAISPVSSGGRDDLMTATVDLDGVASLVGGLPPAGVNFDLVDTPVFKIGASLDLIDVDAGPVLGVTQNFEFAPELMTTITFSKPVQIAGIAMLQDSWTGKWSDLPQIALTETTTFSPTFWIDATLTNDMGLDLNLEGTLDLLKLGATASVGGIDVLGLNPITLNDLLGIDNTLFSTPKMGFDIYRDMFALGGFDPLIGTPFTLTIASSQSGGTKSIRGNRVPVPSNLWLCAIGLVPLVLRRKPSAQTPA